MKNSEVVEKFAKRQAAYTQNLSSDGDKLFSYSTCIAEWVGDHSLVFNNTSYSESSTHHQHLMMLHPKLLYDCTRLIYCDVPRGTRELKRWAIAQNSFV